MNSCQFKKHSRLTSVVSFLAPGQPEAIQVTVLTPRVIHVTWKPPKYKGNGVFGYKIHYNKSSRGIDETISVTELVLGREIRDLRPYTYYKVQVVATSIPHNGPRSFAKVVRTSEAGESLLKSRNALSSLSGERVGLQF